MQTSKILSLLTLMFVITGCFKPGGKSPAELERLGEQSIGNASWIAGEISGKSETSRFDSDFKTPNARLYNFTVCVKDRRTQEPLLTQKFTIQTGAGEKSVRPDVRGCLNWSEEISFNFLADAKFLKLERKITADKSGHSGSRTFGFAVNPWSDKDEVIDLSKVDLPADQTVSGAEVHALLKSEESRKPLYVEDLKLQITRVTGGGSLLRMEFQPKIWLQNVKSERQEFKLNEGKFKIQYSIHAIGSKGLDRAALTKTVEHSNLSMRENRIILEDDLVLTQQPTSGRIELELSVAAVGGPNGLGKFSGTFLIGNADSLKGSHSFDLDPLTVTEGAVAAEAARKSLKPSGDLKLQSATSFDVSPLSGFVQRFEDESASRRSVKYTVKTCLSDPNDSDRRMRGVTIKILKQGKEVTCVNAAGSGSASCTTDQDGCLVWQEAISHNYYEKERYITSEYTFKSENGETKRTAVINPWEADSIFFFIQDLRNLGEATVKAVNERPARDSKIFIPAYSYNRIRTRYTVDSFLSLSTKRTLQLTIDPRVVRDTIRRGRYVMEPLRPGFYLLKSAVHRDLKENGKPVQFVSPVSQIVKVLDGKIVTPVEFSTRDLSIFALRGQLILELSPIDPDKLKSAANKVRLSPKNLDALVDAKSDLKTRSFIGPILLEEKAGVSSLRPTDDLTESYCKTIDCDAFKATDVDSLLENDASRAKFYGSMKHLANVSVSKLTPVFEKNEAEYEQRLKADSNFANFVGLFNAEYVPLQNGPKIAAAVPKLMSLNKMYAVNGTPAQSFLKHLNMPLPSKFTYGLGYQKSAMDLQSLGQLIHGHVLSNNVAARMCAYWMRRLRVASQLYPILVEKCFIGATNQKGIVAKLVDKQNLPPFIIEPKIRIQKMSEPIVELGQKSTMRVGSHFSMGASESLARTNSVSVTPTALLQLVPNKIFQAIASGFNWTLSRDHVWSKDTSRGDDVEAGTSLNIERAATKLTAVEYERCALIRMHPEFINKFTIGNKMQVEKIQDKQWLLTRGVLLCKGFVERTPLPIEESYYFISGSKGEERLLDLDEAQNQPWSIGLRGLSDFNRFMGLIEAKPEEVDSIDRSKSNIDNAGFERLKKAYKFSTPTFPAVISFDATDSAQRH